MCMINCCVYNRLVNKTLFSWKILLIDEPGISVEQYFERKVFQEIQKVENPPKELELESAFLGRSKDSLDRIELSLVLETAASLFGPFLKYHVCVPDRPPDTPTVNAFSVMMYNAQLLSQPGLPPSVMERNKKDRLYNDVLKMLEENNVTFPGDEVKTGGQAFLRAIVDCLWYLDGHHDALKKQNCSIPELFSHFNGYNTPEVSKHRKRSISNLSGSTLEMLSSTLFHNLQKSIWSREKLKPLHRNVEQLARSVASYADYLSSQRKKMNTLHSLVSPVRQVSDSMSVKFVKASTGVLSCSTRLEMLSSCLRDKSEYEFVSLCDFLPDTSRARYEYIQTLERNGLPYPIMLLTHSSGNNIGNLHFVWKLPAGKSIEATFEDSIGAVEDIKQILPQYHTRAMRREMFTKFGRISPSVNPAALRFLYRELTGDSSASHDTPEEIIDERVRSIILMEPEDPRTVVDLREVKSQETKTKYDVFWDEARKYINEEIGVAVDDRRHGEVTHMAKAISVRDLREQVTSKCPPGTHIPSEEWLRLQFWPKTKAAKVAMQYTGRLNVRYMVQKRQFRKTHDDAHYAAALYRYMREYALKLREYCTMVSIDDKHRLKVGEPGFPVAAAERGRRVMVRAGTTFEVGDHDFTKFSIIPSVVLLIDVPTRIDDSWYQGQVLVGFKDAAFESSSPLRHATELSSMLRSKEEYHKPVLFVYSDGGPDHRITYVSVQISLIALFLTLDLDFICAVRTAPSHSWRNPVERIMSTLNLGLQCVGLMREKGEDEFEKEAAKCNSLSALQDAAKKDPTFQEAAMDSLSHVKSLLVQLLGRLQLKGKKFVPFFPASEADIDALWDEVVHVDSTLNREESITKKKLPEKQDLQAFMKHCCVRRHYSFQVKKCGSDSCSMCRPPRLPKTVFDTISVLPDPVPDEDGHYKAFKQLLGTPTDGSFRPSLQKVKKTLPFSASVQHVKNVDMLQCEECSMWRLLYSRYKLTHQEKTQLKAAVEDLSFTCGAPLQDLGLPGRLNDVYTRQLHCEEPIEKLYYSAKYDPICIYCAEDVNTMPADSYPQCDTCKDKPAIMKK